MNSLTSYVDRAPQCPADPPPCYEALLISAHHICQRHRRRKSASSRRVSKGQPADRRARSVAIRSRRSRGRLAPGWMLLAEGRLPRGSNAVPPLRIRRWSVRTWPRWRRRMTRSKLAQNRPRLRRPLRRRPDQRHHLALEHRAKRFGPSVRQPRPPGVRPADGYGSFCHARAPPSLGPPSAAVASANSASSISFLRNTLTVIVTMAAAHFMDALSGSLAN